jgi:mycothiol system anti-sigma-R factor
MSTPDQSKMKQDCDNKKDCLEMLQLIIDGEATSAQKDHFLKEHLDQCMPCYKSYNLELAIRQLLKTKCSDHAPQELVDSIRKKVAENLVR